MIIILTSKNFYEYLNETICVKHLSQCLEHRFNIGYYFAWGWISQEVCGRIYQSEAASIFLPYSSSF